MTATAVIGLQWGDEAKGKIVDLLTDQHDVVVRYQGGNNAGHTVCFDGEKYKLSLLPAGVLHPGIVSVIASGVVINPEAFLDELSGIENRLGKTSGDELLISDRAHVIMPYHLAEEAILEARSKDNAIGTTMRGIGTCYRDKAGRSHAIRMGDLLHPDLLKTRLEEIVSFKNVVLKALDANAPQLSAAEIFETYQKYAERLAPHITDTTSYLHKAIATDKKLLFEGAQGSLLDIDHGTFPFVTSSSSSGAGIHSGSGVPERAIGRLIGVVKAYTTRVGGGPFPTELHDEIGQHIRDTGNEYGTVTGRPRRCGWFDAVASSYGARISGVDHLTIALLDVLDGLGEVQICAEYEIDGERTTDFPSHVEELAKVKPVYKTLPGWNSDTTAARKLSDLPSAARGYIDTICELLDAPPAFISVGPDREQTITCD